MKMTEKQIRAQIHKIENDMTDVRFNLSESKTFEELSKARIAFAELEGMRTAFLLTLGLDEIEEEI